MSKTFSEDFSFSIYESDLAPESPSLLWERFNTSRFELWQRASLVVTILQAPLQETEF